MTAVPNAVYRCISPVCFRRVLVCDLVAVPRTDILGSTGLSEEVLFCYELFVFAFVKVMESLVSCASALPKVSDRGSTIV